MKNDYNQNINNRIYIYPVTVKRFLYNDFMMSCDNFFQSEECKKWIEYAENIGFQLQFHEATKDIAYRNNYRIQFNDDNLANNIFQRLAILIVYLIRETLKIKTLRENKIIKRKWCTIVFELILLLGCIIYKVNFTKLPYILIYKFRV